MWESRGGGKMCQGTEELTEANGVSKTRVRDRRTEGRGQKVSDTTGRHDRRVQPSFNH